MQLWISAKDSQRLPPNFVSAAYNSARWQAPFCKKGGRAGFFCCVSQEYHKILRFLQEIHDNIGRQMLYNSIKGRGIKQCSEY